MVAERIPFRAMLVLAISALLGSCADRSSGPPEPVTPIEHVIVVVGENLSFDALFATYVPPGVQLLFMGGTGQPQAQPDCRYPTDLPSGPYQITGPYPPLPRAASCPDLLPVEPIDNAGDPVHSFFQMWQQSDCSMAHATADNPSGCLGDLTTWVAVSVGWAVGRPPTTDQATAQGGTPMGFYNIAAGDLPYFRELAETYAMSDN